MGKVGGLDNAFITGYFRWCSSGIYADTFEIKRRKLTRVRAQYNGTID
jgi:hypothetical protein